jgi:hypothetical protein
MSLSTLELTKPSSTPFAKRSQAIVNFLEFIGAGCKFWMERANVRRGAGYRNPKRSQLVAE